MRLASAAAFALLTLQLPASHLNAQAGTAIQTTADQKDLLLHKPLAFAPGAPAGKVTLLVDPTLRLQTMDGFGASLTDSSAALIAPLPAAQRDALLHELFAPDGPLALTLLRQPIGASDFSSRGDYSYDDPPNNKPDPTLAHFSLGPDTTSLFPLLREAQHLNPQLRIMALPWSAPAWMKSNNSMRAGSLQDRYLDTYAHYLARTAEAYSAQGVPLFAMALQNEPLNENPSYPTQNMPPAQEAALAAKLQPLLNAAGRSPQLLGYEHNWNNLDYPTQLLAAAPNLFAGISFHCYGGSEAAQAAFLRDHPRTSLWFTECSAINSSSFAESFLWQGRHLLLGAPANGARSVLLWNVVLDPRGNPHNGGCNECTPLLQLDPKSPGLKLQRTAGFYLLAHASPYIHPGATHLGLAVSGSADLRAEAFQNLDGTLVVLALNLGQSPADISLGTAAASAAYTLPARALATFLWNTPSPAVAEGTYRLSLQGSGLTAIAGQASPALQPLSTSPAQLWTINRLPSGRYEIRNVATAQALAVAASGTLATLTLEGSRIAALPLKPTANGFCIQLSARSACAETVLASGLPGNLLLAPIAPASTLDADK